MSEASEHGLPEHQGPRKRVARLLTGGTLVMRAGAEGALLPDVYAHDLIRELPVLRRRRIFIYGETEKRDIGSSKY